MSNLLRPRPGKRVVIFWNSQVLPSGSLNVAKEKSGPLSRPQLRDGIGRAVSKHETTHNLDTAGNGIFAGSFDIGNDQVEKRRCAA